MNLHITKIVRKGKFHSRVTTSDGRQLVVDNGAGTPYVGQELPILAVEPSVEELRPLEARDIYPQIIDFVELE